ncbi:MAG TPA: hypothetical protein VGK16_08305, partial [Candidatus Limnocylindrales bacterium]
MHRMISALIERQGGWAKPLGERAQEVAGEVFAGRAPLKDALNGTWFGHPVHPVVTDIPVGAMTLAVLLDVTGNDRGADLAVATGLAGMAASAATGVADAVDAEGKPQLLATVHSTLMIASFGAYVLSFLLRLGPRG